jgi:hemoglobin-like flavoprotein
MTAADARRVRESWRALTPRAEELAAVFYGELFACEPECARLLSGASAEQRQKFARMVGTLADAGDDPRAFIATAAALGRRHAGYGVRAAHYDAAGLAMRRMLEHALGPAFTRELRDAWSEAVLLVIAVMRRSAPA